MALFKADLAIANRSVDFIGLILDFKYQTAGQIPVLIGYGEVQLASEPIEAFEISHCSLVYRDFWKAHWKKISKRGPNWHCNRDHSCWAIASETRCYGFGSL